MVKKDFCNELLPNKNEWKEDEKNSSDGGGSTTKWMYLMSLNYTPKYGLDGTFYVYFHSIKNKWQKLNGRKRI